MGLFMGPLSIPEILLILVIVAIIFGAGKLPKVMGDFGKGIRNFKDGMKDKTEVETAPNPSPSAVTDDKMVATPPSSPVTKEGDGPRA